MIVLPHNEQTVHTVPRIKTRILTGDATEDTAMWEQWIHAAGHIPPHYHEVEEVLLFLQGNVALTTDSESVVVRSPATVVIPAGELHAMRPHQSPLVHLIACFPTSDPKIYAQDGRLRPMPWDDTEVQSDDG